MHANSLFKVLHRFEAEFCQEKQEFMKILHRDLSTIHRQFEQNTNVWSAMMMVKFKLALNRVLLSFANNNNNFNANYACESVGSMLMSNLVTNPENNITNQLVDSVKMGHLLSKISNSDENVQPIKQCSNYTIACSVDDNLKLSTLPPIDKSNQQILQMQAYSYLVGGQCTNIRPVARKTLTSVSIIRKRTHSHELGDHKKAAKNAKMESTQPNEQQSRCQLVQPLKANNDNPTKRKQKHTNNLQTNKMTNLKCFKLNCEQEFRKWNSLRHHMINEHHIDTAPCLVKYCDQTFTNIWKREKHIQTHHHNTKMHCAKCARTYINGGFLKRHYSKHHSNQYKCTFPNCAFKSDLGFTVSWHYFNNHHL